MANIELYINKELCDIGKLDSFSVYLKRQLLNPAELNTKDAQRSYDITLPASAVNNRIFGHINVEETKGKFARLYDALLLVNGIAIFEGKFKLNEITKHTYKGNLGIPAQKTVRDIFGDKMMNQAGEWRIDFKDFYNSISEYNKSAKDAPQPCIFPYIIYSLVPKIKSGTTMVNGVEKDSFTPKDVIDKYARLALDNFPPAINPLKAIKEIFKSNNLEIDGTAFNDPKLTKLYMSYRNPSQYIMPWNWSRVGQIKLKGTYTIAELLGNMIQSTNGGWHNDGIYDANSQFFTHNGKKQWRANVFDSDKNIVHEITNNNISVKDGKVTLNISKSGLYKIDLYGKLNIPDHSNGDTSKTWWGIGLKDEPDPYKFKLATNYVGRLGGWEFNNNITNTRFELQLIRYNKDSPFELDKQKVLASYGRPNQDQDSNTTSGGWYPNHKLFVDGSNNENFICGGSFGRYHSDTNLHYEHFINNNEIANNLSNYPYCNTMYCKYGLGWDGNYTQKRVNYSVTPIYKNQFHDYRYVYATNTGNSPSNQIDYMVDTPNFDYANDWNTRIHSENKKEFHSQQIVWLEQGDFLTLVDCSDAGQCRMKNNVGQFSSTDALVCHNWEYELTITPFRSSLDWMQMTPKGKGIEPMDWNAGEWLHNHIDLIKFLPKEVKVDEWLNNFCKVFNLNLIQINDTVFELNVKQKQSLVRSKHQIDLDNKTDININGRNTSLELPSTYEIGFSINKSEEGFVESSEDGGGFFETGAVDSKPISQTSTFSYNWFKKMHGEGDITYPPFPIITDKEIWVEDSKDYAEMLSKTYTNLAQRFFYFKDTFQFGENIITENPLLASVSGSFDETNLMTLNYKNKENTILTKYFNILKDSNNNYTTIECYLSPKEYSLLANSTVKLNGDLYYVAEIDGYDPLGRKKATLKLIRKTL